MKKLLAMLLVLAVGLIPMLALAEEELCTRTMITLDGVEALQDYSIVCMDQHTGAKQYTFDVLKGEESILSVKSGISEDGGAVYISASPLGDQIFAFTGEDLLTLFFQLLEKAADSGVFSSQAFSDFVDTVLNEISASAETANVYAALDFSQLNLTPILMAILSLQNCVRIVDVENYELEEERFGAEKDEEGNAKAGEAEEIEEELPELDPVCVEVFITLSADEAQLLVNAICETIALNPSLMALFGDRIDAFTELQEEFISKMAEDLNIQIGLDEASIPVFSSMTFSLEQEDTIRSYVFENSTDLNQETGDSMISLNGKYSDDTEMVYHYLFDATFVNNAEGCQFTTTLGDVDAEYITLSVSAPATVENETARTDEEIASLKGMVGDEAFDFAIDIVKVQEAGVETITAKLLIGETAIASLNIMQEEVESMEPTDLTNAIYPCQMEEEAFSAYSQELLGNASAWFEDLVATLGAAA